MKIAIPCIQCSFGPEPSRLTVLRPIGNTSFYDIACENGHAQRVRLRNNKFEVLFESGIEALKAGFCREALTSFAVAQERFYEFSILFFLMDVLSDQSKDSAELERLRKFDKFWSGKLKLSERQLGAFCSLYVSEFHEMPTLFDGTETRNRVVHAGYIPSYEETLEFGQKVNESMLSLVKRYYEKDEKRQLKRVLLVPGLSATLDLIRLKMPIQHGASSQASLFIDVTDGSYLDGSRSLSEYIREAS